jgi:hypothetical protein
VTEQQAAQVEQSTPAPAPATAPEPAHSPGVAKTLSLLMAREAKVRQATEEQKAQTDYQRKYQELESLIEKDPLQALKLKGHSYESLSQRVLAEDPVAAKTVALTKEVSELKSAIQLREQQEAEQAQLAALQEAQDRLKGFIDSSGKFKLVQKLGFHAAAYQHLQDQVKANPDAPISEEDAAQVIEAQLERLLDLAMEDEEVRAKYYKAPVSLTLSNRHSAQVPTRTDMDNLTREQRNQILVDQLTQRR